MCASLTDEPQLMITAGPAGMMPPQAQAGNYPGMAPGAAAGYPGGQPGAYPGQYAPGYGM